DVQAALEGQAGMLVVDGVRRRDDDGVEAGIVDQLGGVLRGEAKAEALLHPAQLGFAEPANGGQLDVVAGGEEGHVVGRRPPTGAEKTETKLHGVPVLELCGRRGQIRISKSETNSKF